MVAPTLEPQWHACHGPTHHRGGQSCNVQARVNGGGGGCEQWF